LEQTDAKLQPATAKRLKKEIKAFEKQKSEYSRKLFRFSESTFWREISYIED
jgi:hypothetical protein